MLYVDLKLSLHHGLVEAREHLARLQWLQLRDHNDATLPALGVGAVVEALEVVGDVGRVILERYHVLSVTTERLVSVQFHNVVGEVAVVDEALHVQLSLESNHSCCCCCSIEERRPRLLFDLVDRGQRVVAREHQIRVRMDHYNGKCLDTGEFDCHVAAEPLLVYVYAQINGVVVGPQVRGQPRAIPASVSLVVLEELVVVVVGAVGGRHVTAAVGERQSLAALGNRVLAQAVLDETEDEGDCEQNGQACERRDPALGFAPGWPVAAAATAGFVFYIGAAVFD